MDGIRYVPTLLNQKNSRSAKPLIWPPSIFFLPGILSRLVGRSALIPGADIIQCVFIHQRMKTYTDKSINALRVRVDFLTLSCASKDL